jgi:4-amino-4-deoxy-L-arabinose transferase-like glycosyltransferase
MLGSFGPMDPTDSFFLESGRQMCETGQFLLPMDNYQIWLDKPILAFWVIAGLFKVFGVSTFVGRLVSAVPAFILGGLIYPAARPFFNRRTCLMASCIFLSSPLIVVIGRTCLTDMLLALLISGSLFSFAQVLIDGASSKKLIAAYISLALAVLCKGPIAIILVAAVLILYMVLSESGKDGYLRFCGALKPLWGIVIIAAFNLPWYLAAIAATQGRFFYDFFIRQNFGRMVGTVNHQNPWWFYIPVFFAGLFPWSLYVVSSPLVLKESIAARREKSGANAFTLLCLCWAAVVLVLFGLLKTKLPTYILPSLPATAILIACQIDSLISRQKVKRLGAIAFVVLVVALGSFVFKGTVHGFVGSVIKQNSWLLLVIVCGFAANFFLLLAKRVKQATLVLFASVVVASAFFVPLSLAAEFKERQQGFNDLVLMAKASNGELAILVAEQPGMTYLLHKSVPRITCQAEARAFLASPGSSHWVVVPKEVANDLTWLGGKTKLVAQSGKWLLYSCQPD